MAQGAHHREPVAEEQGHHDQGQHHPESHQQQHDEQAAERKSLVGSGDRSERIRTYNFHQGRVSDHRIGLDLYKIDAIIDGDLDEIIDALTMHERAEKMKVSE